MTPARRSWILERLVQLDEALQIERGGALLLLEQQRLEAELGECGEDHRPVRLYSRRPSVLALAQRHQPRGGKKR